MIEVCPPGGEQDVRWVMAGLRAAGELTVEGTPWGRFHHAYGTAEDVPAMLRLAADPEAGRAEQGRAQLWNKGRHQGTSDTALALAVPFLLRLATDPAVHGRHELLRLAAEAGHRNHFEADTRTSLFQVVEDEEPGAEMIDGYGRPVAWTWQAAREAVTADAPLLVGLLDDAEPLVRVNAAYAIAGGLEAWPAVELRARVATETDPAVRISLVFAGAQLAPDQAWAAALWADEKATEDVRFAAAIAWLCGTAAPVPDRIFDLFVEVVGPTLAGWLRDVPWHNGMNGPSGLVGWLLDFLEVEMGPVIA